jgi:hypothetical protein
MVLACDDRFAADHLGGRGFDDTDLLNVDPLLGPLQDNGGPS